MSTSETIDLSDIPAQLERLAGEMRSGKLLEQTCIVLLTTEENDDYASYWFGKEITYGGAIDVVGSLLEELHTEAAGDAVVTIN